MADEYTPTTQDILRYFDPPFAVEPKREDEDFDAFMDRCKLEAIRARTEAAAAARRWLATHDREVAAKVLRDAAGGIVRGAGLLPPPKTFEHPAVRWLMESADRIESQTNEKGASDGEQ